MKPTVGVLCMTALAAACLAHSIADFNKDDVVDFLDFADFSSQWLGDANELPASIQPDCCDTLLIAAESSPDYIKAKANYVCDGTDDQVEIQEAIDDMPSIGGAIYLAEGEYRISDTIRVDKPVFFRGAGVNWHYQGGLTRIYPVSGLNGPIIDSVGNYYLGGLFDIGFDGSYLRDEVDSPAVLLRANGGDYHIERCGFYYLPFLSAVEARCHNVWIHDTCFEDIKHSSPDCFAVTVPAGVRNRFVNCHFRDNKNCIWFGGSGVEDWIVRCDFHDTDCTILRLGASYGNVSDSTLWGCNERREDCPMIEVTENVWNWTIHDCDIMTFCNTPIVRVAEGRYLTHFIFHGNRILNSYGPPGTWFTGTIINSEFVANLGYRTANGGEAVVANGFTIAHGLVSQPTVVTLTASVPGRLVAAAATDDTTITVSIRDPNNEDITVPEPVYWYAECK